MTKTTITEIRTDDITKVCPYRTNQTQYQTMDGKVKVEVEFPICYKGQCPFWEDNKCIRPTL